MKTIILNLALIILAVIAAGFSRDPALGICIIALAVFIKDD